MWYGNHIKTWPGHGRPENFFEWARDRVGITNVNLSNLKTGKVKAIRFTTLNAICRELSCQPGDILEYEEDAEE